MKILLSIFVIYILGCMVLNPAAYLAITLDGLTAWALNVLPSVLVFVFLTKVLTSLGSLEKASKIFSKPMRALYGAPQSSSYVFMMSVLSGYPVGSKMIADLYESDKITRTDAFRMSAFCSNSGPMFIIGAVGAGMFGDARIGYIIFASHLLSALLNGLIYRKIKVKDLPRNGTEKRQNVDLAQMVLDSALSLISVGTIIAIFFVVIASLGPILSLFPPPVAALCSGLIEITKGSQMFGALGGKMAVVLASFVITFGGISTILQSLTMLNKIKMPAWLFALEKLTQALLAGIISLILVQFI